MNNLPGTLMRGRVNPPRAAADDGDAYVGQLVSQFACGLQAVGRGHPRSHQGHGILVLRTYLAFDV